MNQVIRNKQNVKLTMPPLWAKANVGSISTLDPDWHQCVIEVAIQGEQPLCTIFVTEAADYIGLE